MIVSNVYRLFHGCDALQLVEKNGEVCPANRTRGTEAISPTPDGSQRFFSSAFASQPM